MGRRFYVGHPVTGAEIVDDCGLIMARGSEHGFVDRLEELVRLANLGSEAETAQETLADLEKRNDRQAEMIAELRRGVDLRRVRIAESDRDYWKRVANGRTPMFEAALRAVEELGAECDELRRKLEDAEAQAKRDEPQLPTYAEVVALAWDLLGRTVDKEKPRLLIDLARELREAGRT